MLNASSIATLQPESSDGGLVGERQVVATIAFHPELGRIGERLPVGIHASTVEISRNRGGFGPDAQPLEDPHLSRQPIRLRLDWRRGLTVAAARPERVTLGGRPLSDPVALSIAQLERGVVLGLSKRVALLLHLGQTPSKARDHGLVGSSHAIDMIRTRIDQVADLPIPVLLRGETGVGKDLVARAIHSASDRVSRPCVCVNMGAISASTAVSELFGHARGSFTGANERHVGLFERADGGTIFLDEIGETPDIVQPMLLRVLEGGEFLGVGAEQPGHTDVRVIAATDADLEEAERAGTFRSALLHRLAGFEIAIPPLRQRREDIAQLVVHFLRDELDRIGQGGRLEQGVADKRLWFRPRVMQRLLDHDWPGNARQLRNVVRHLVIANRNRERLAIDDRLGQLLVPSKKPAPAGAVAGSRPAELSEELVSTSLRNHGWAPGPTATALGVPRSTLYDFIEKSAGLRTARDVEAGELERSFESCAGDVAAMSRALQVSARGIKLRLRDSGLIS